MFGFNGENMKIVISRSGSRIYYEVEGIVLHPLFNANTLANDIALIKVSDPITFVPNTIQPATIDVTGIKGGTTLTMKDGIQVSDFNEIFFLHLYVQLF